MSFSAMIVPFLIYWLALFVTTYITVEYGQNWLYAEPTRHFPIKVAVGTFALAALLTVLPLEYATMFTTSKHWLLLQAVIWFVVFTLLFEFHPPHAFVISVVMILTIPGLASMAVGSLRESRRPATIATPTVAPLGPRPSGGAAPTTKTITPPDQARPAGPGVIPKPPPPPPEEEPE
ncbi:MAG TPA: hypothetical protein VG406_04285 [Isosphaeraceae bacterium]|jgi:hypothetical protein|nr:hypothetical protein [Isosphaeraceae bacterium]